MSIPPPPGDPTDEPATVRESGDPEAPYGVRQRAGLVAGPLLFAILLVLPPPAGLAPPGWRVAATALLMAIWWITEAVPIPVTSLLPMLLLPVLGVGTIGAASAPYFNPLIVLFLGGFIVALAMERWNLHRRIALSIIRVMGTRPRAVIAGFMAASAFLSMWVSNTATAMMMLPIGLSVVRLGRAERTSFAVALMLGIAYGCSIGGMATLIGTPPNAFLAAYLEQTHGFRITFLSWMAIGVPVMLCGLPIAHALLTRFVFPIDIEDLAGGREVILREYRALGPMRRGERLAALVFVAVAVLWVSQPLLADLLPGLSDAGIAVAGAVALFLLPVDLRRGTFVMDWATAERLPWGVLLLFGGGLSLADAVTRTGLAEWIGSGLGGLAGWPAVVVVLGVTLVIVLLTEVNSNTATAAAFLPIVFALAVSLGQDPLLLVIPAALGASAAFMLPVATPPNAIVYGSGFLTVPQMARAGIYLNLLFVVVVVALTWLLAGPVFGAQPGTVPPWAGGPPG